MDNRLFRITYPARKKYGIVDGPFGSNLKTEHYKKSGIPIVTSGYVTSGVFFADEYLYVDEEKFKQEKRSAVHGGDIVMAKIGANCGASAILPKNHPESILSGNALKISIDEKRHSNIYIWQVMWSLHKNGSFDAIRSTGAQPAVSMANLKKYKIPLPIKAEQQLIATALSDTDLLIESLEKLIVKKRQIKQGAMQELLTPKEGWEVKKLGEIATFHKGKGLSKSHLIENGKYKCIHYGELFTKYKERINHILSYTNENENAFYSASNDVLMPTSDVTPNGLATASCIDEDGVILGGDVLVIRLPKNILNGIYFSYYVTQNREQVMKLVSGSTVYHLYGSDMNELNVQFPTIDKQTAIATILSDMDAEITALESRLEKTRTLKSGMMYELLTGRIRLL